MHWVVPGGHQGGVCRRVDPPSHAYLTALTCQNPAEAVLSHEKSLLLLDGDQYGTLSPGVPVSSPPTSLPTPCHPLPPPRPQYSQRSPPPRVDDFPKVPRMKRYDRLWGVSGGVRGGDLAADPELDRSAVLATAAWEGCRHLCWVVCGRPSYQRRRQGCRG